MEHTPGPWNGISEKRGVFVMAGSYCVASMADVRTSSDCTGHETANANARLIAAAPELLEACKKAMSRIEELHGDWGRDYSDSTLMVLDKAIAKAEGRS